jgi:CheY-like chemotaxis protein
MPLSPRPRVLFVDDHEDTRFLMLTWLGAMDYEVAVAASVKEGIKRAQTEAFDLYLLDSRFADGSGKELCEKIREFDETTPIVFYSGEPPQKQAEVVVACEAQGYAVKPDFDALSKIMSHALHAV